MHLHPSVDQGRHAKIFSKRPAPTVLLTAKYSDSDGERWVGRDDVLSDCPRQQLGDAIDRMIGNALDDEVLARQTLFLAITLTRAFHVPEMK